MTLIICESLREIGEVACVTSAWSSRGQTLKNVRPKKVLDAAKYLVDTSKLFRVE